MSAALYTLEEFVRDARSSVHRAPRFGNTAAFKPRARLRASLALPSSRHFL